MSGTPTKNPPISLAAIEAERERLGAGFNEAQPDAPADDPERYPAETVRMAAGAGISLAAEGARAMGAATVEMDGHIATHTGHPNHGQVAAWLASMADGCRLLAMGLTLTANHLEAPGELRITDFTREELDHAAARAPLEVAQQFHGLAAHNQTRLAEMIQASYQAPRTLRATLSLAHYQAARQHDLAFQLLGQIQQFHDGADLDYPAITIRNAGQLHGILERLNSWAAQLHTEIGRNNWRIER